MDTSTGGPEIGRWYRHLDKGEMFQVVGFDEKSGTVEIQAFDGDLDEIDADAWDERLLVPAEPPEDWTGPMGEIERDDLGYTNDEPPQASPTQPPE